MSALPEPKFAIADRVYELISRYGSDGRRVLGTVTSSYVVGGVYRFRVEFDDGTEGTFFEFEIVPT